MIDDTKESVKCQAQNLQNKTCIVYALCHDNEIRYVGQTIKTPKARLEKHISDSKRLNKTAVHRWINKLILSGQMPKVIVLQEDATWNLSEIEHIKILKENNTRLLNLTIGGDGLIGLKRTEEHCKKISIAKRKYTFTAEHKKNMSLGQSGKILTQEHKNKISNCLKGKPKSAEHIINAAKSRKGKRTKARSLSIEQEKNILQIIDNGQISQRILAKQLGIKRGIIQHILRTREKND